MCKLRNLTFDRAFSRISKLYIKVFYIPAVLSVDFNINFQCVKTVIFHKQVSFLEVDRFDERFNKQTFKKCFLYNNGFHFKCSKTRKSFCVE